MYTIAYDTIEVDPRLRSVGGAGVGRVREPGLVLDSMSSQSQRQF